MLRSFGSSKDEGELRVMEQEASEYIRRYGGQGVLSLDCDMCEQPQVEADHFFNRIVDIRQDAPRIILGRVYDGIGFGSIKDNTLRSLAIARVC